MRRKDQDMAALVPVGLALGVALGTVIGFFLHDPGQGLAIGGGVGLAMGALLFAAGGREDDAANDR